MDATVLSIKLKGKPHVGISLAGGPLVCLLPGIALCGAAKWSIVGESELAEHIRQAVCMALRGEFGDASNRPDSRPCRATSQLIAAPVMRRAEARRSSSAFGRAHRATRGADSRIAHAATPRARP
jgi:hypothetical protein